MLGSPVEGKELLHCIILGFLEPSAWYAPSKVLIGKLLPCRMLVCYLHMRLTTWSLNSAVVAQHVKKRHSGDKRRSALDSR